MRNTARARRFPADILNMVLRKMDVINAAHKLNDLCSPPGNRLEALKGDLAGYYSIRVNKQWRITFRWQDGAENVASVDYH